MPSSERFDKKDELPTWSLVARPITERLLTLFKRPVHPHPKPATPAPMNWPALITYLAQHGHTLTQGERLSGGLANQNYRVTLDGAPAVLRRPPDGPLPPGAHDMAREYRLLTALPPVLPFVPRGLYLCTDITVIGVPFQIMQFRAGRIIGATLPPDRAGQGAALTETMLTTLAAIHAVDPDAVGLGDLGKPAGFLARATEGWVRRGLAADGPPAIARLGTWLRAHAVPDGPVALLHNDFKLDNMILDDTLAPNAVVDWDQGTRGDALFDLATTLSYWTEADDHPAMAALHQMPTDAPGFLTRAEAATRYAALTGRDVSDLRFYRVLGQLKLGVIFLQLHARHGATDPRYAGFGTLAAGLLDVAELIAAGEMF